jgi:hypothetical protein
MKVFVSIVFPRKHYLAGKYGKHKFIDYLANKYNSTGSLVFCNGEDPRLWCDTPVELIEQLIYDCFSEDNKIVVTIRYIEK